MKIIAVLALLVLLSALIKAQSRTSREIDGLVGPVHTVSVTSLTMTKVNDLWDESDRRISQFTEYDENGNDPRRPTDASPQSSASCIAKTNDNGQAIETDCDWHGKSMKKFFKYDAAGHVIDESLEEDGKLASRVTYSFDEQGRMTSIRQYNSENELIRKLTFSRDDKARRSEGTTSLLKDGKLVLIEKGVSTFDERGNVLTATTENAEGMKFTQYYSYEFDHFGNWIVKETATLPLDSSSLNTKHVEIRVIMYYAK